MKKLILVVVAMLIGMVSFASFDKEDKVTIPLKRELLDDVSTGIERGMFVSATAVFGLCRSGYNAWTARMWKRWDLYGYFVSGIFKTSEGVIFDDERRISVDENYWYAFNTITYEKP